MDWTVEIERNREALKRVLAMLVAMAGLADSRACGEAAGGAPTLPRHLHRAVLRLLRPAESATRRLVIVKARGLAATPQARNGENVPPPQASPGARALPRSAPRPHTLPLFDPPRRPFRLRGPAPNGVPRIWFAGAGEPFPVHPPSPLDDIDATRLALRLAALSRALDDLPAQARRFARWRARAAAGALGRKDRRSGRGRRVWPLRAGRPPGQRLPSSRRPVHEVHEILHDLHGLAFDVLECPDTS